eukprot:4446255-Amphidinium_carterae.1
MSAISVPLFPTACKRYHPPSGRLLQAQYLFHIGIAPVTQGSEHTTSWVDFIAHPRHSAEDVPLRTLAAHDTLVVEASASFKGRMLFDVCQW